MHGGYYDPRQFLILKVGAADGTVSRTAKRSVGTVRVCDSVSVVYMQPAAIRSFFMPLQLLSLLCSGVPPPFQCVSRFTAFE